MDLGLERAGLGPTTVQVEIDDYATGVLARHWPHVTRYRDVREVRNLPYTDTICGGFPCQDLSPAGKRAGLAGERSGLWREYARIVGEVRPSRVIVENVAGNTRGWLPYVRRDLHLLGYRTRALKLSAFDCGAPHRRERVFVLAADPERLQLRDEQRWRGGPNRQGPDESVDDGEEGTAASFWRWSRDGDGWTFESEIPRVAHGVSNRLDRERLMGNACTPQQAETVGCVMLAWTR